MTSRIVMEENDKNQQNYKSDSRKTTIGDGDVRSFGRRGRD